MRYEYGRPFHKFDVVDIYILVVLIVLDESDQCIVDPLFVDNKILDVRLQMCML